MTMNWVRSNAYSGVPPNAVAAGYDVDGATIFVGRAHYANHLIPAKVIPSKRIAYVAHAGNEIAKHEYEILTGFGFEWVRSSNGHIPPNAVVGGKQSDGTTLYVGRTSIGGSLAVGKIHPYYKCIYVPFGGAEHSDHYYEVLVAQHSGPTLFRTEFIHYPHIAPMRSSWLPSSRYAQLPHGAVIAGHDQDQSPIYVGRAWHSGDLLPAKVLPTKHAAYVCYGGREHLVEQFEVLCHGNTSWHTFNPRSRRIPAFPVSGGKTSDNETLYIGRAHHQGSLTVGKVQFSHGTLYIPFGGDEVSIQSECEILTEN